MRATKAIRYEMKRTLGDNKIALGVCLLFLVVVQIAYVAKANHLGGIGTLSAGDVVASVNWGMQPFDPATRRFFILDMVWAAPYFLLGYLACSALTDAVRRQAYQVLTRTCSRVIWVASKYIRMVTIVLAYIVVEVLAAILLAVAFGGTASLIPTQGNEGVPIDGGTGFGALALTYPLILLAPLAFAMLITTLALVITPLMTYLFLIAFVIASAYFAFPLLFVGGSMVVRSILVTGDWSATAWVLSVCIAVILLSPCIGYVATRKVELL